MLIGMILAKKNLKKIWKWKHKCEELDIQQRQAGNGLDELNAHRFLEAFNQTMTVREMRDALRSSGADDKFTVVPITHFLVCLFKADWKYLINASQGDNKEEIEQAQRMLAAVQVALRDAEEKAHEAAKALASAESAEANARAKEKEAKAKEAEAEAAKRELEAALADLKAQEDAYNTKAEELKHKSENAPGVVAQNKAKAELAQHQNEPTLPLRKARITQEAAVKKADKTRIAAAEARAAAEASTAKAIESRKQATAARDVADRAVDQARSKVEEAENFLQMVKQKPGNAAGAMWWIERELHEVKAFLPERKGGYKKEK